MINLKHTDNTCAVGYTNFNAILEPGDAAMCRMADPECSFSPCFQARSPFPEWGPFNLHSVEGIELYVTDFEHRFGAYWYIETKKTSKLTRLLMHRLGVTADV